MPSSVGEAGVERGEVPRLDCSRDVPDHDGVRPATATNSPGTRYRLPSRKASIDARVLVLDGAARRLVESRVGEGDRSADERGAAGVLCRLPREGRLQPFGHDVDESDVRENRAERTSAAEGEKSGQTADFTRASTMGKISAHPQRRPDPTPPRRRARPAGSRASFPRPPSAHRAHTSIPARTK